VDLRRFGDCVIAVSSGCLFEWGVVVFVSLMLVLVLLLLVERPYKVYNLRLLLAYWLLSLVLRLEFGHV
jgi:hypothetical protein